MKKVCICALFLLTVVQSGFAALPPFYESLAEITTILKDNQLADRLGSGEMITSIVKNDQGYLITGVKYKIQVNVIFQKNDKIGPAKFQLRFEEPTSISSAS